MTTDLNSIEDHLRKIEILLAGVLLKTESPPEVAKLEKLIRLRKGKLSDLFPQRTGKGRAITDVYEPSLPRRRGKPISRRGGKA